METLFATAEDESKFLANFVPKTQRLSIFRQIEALGDPKEATEVPEATPNTLEESPEVFQSFNYNGVV